MKKHLLVVLFALQGISFTLLAQNRDYPWAIAIGGGNTQYSGDLGNGFFNFRKAFYEHGSLSVIHYINSKFDLTVNGSTGKIGFWKDAENNFLGRHSQVHGAIRFKLNNGLIMRANSKVAPYIFAGAGYADFAGDRIDVPGGEVFMTVGFGFNFNLTQQFVINYQSSFAPMMTDKRDYDEYGGNDWYLRNTLMLQYNFSLKMKDEDGDGIPDKEDKCPGTLPGIKVDGRGCPMDIDHDGVPDYLDSCANTPHGIKVDVKGCPLDADGDGIPDYLDKCPNEAGLAQFDGCPDTDGDGIVDSLDACPNEAGLAQFEGCPDRDGDGIIDKEDRCPDIAGLAAFKGCPDTDGDGIPDIDDRCPTVKGIPENKGCPEIKETTKKVFEKALQGIQFESGKDKIITRSFPILNEIVKIMEENPEYKLSIEGHTDSQGDDQKNLILSQNRAIAVMNYMAGKGVSLDRVSAKGYGETIPVATNDTAAGRALNRRVEFKVLFE